MLIDYHPYTSIRDRKIVNWSTLEGAMFAFPQNAHCLRFRNFWLTLFCFENLFFMLRNSVLRGLNALWERHHQFCLHNSFLREGFLSFLVLELNFLNFLKQGRTVRTPHVTQSEKTCIQIQFFCWKMQSNSFHSNHFFATRKVRIKQ